MLGELRGAGEWTLAKFGDPADEGDGRLGVLFDDRCFRLRPCVASDVPSLPSSHHLASTAALQRCRRDSKVLRIREPSARALQIPSCTGRRSSRKRRPQILQGTRQRSSPTSGDSHVPGVTPCDKVPKGNDLRAEFRLLGVMSDPAVVGGVCSISGPSRSLCGVAAASAVARSIPAAATASLESLSSPRNCAMTSSSGLTLSVGHGGTSRRDRAAFAPGSNGAGGNSGEARGSYTVVGRGGVQAVMAAAVLLLVPPLRLSRWTQPGRQTSVRGRACASAVGTGEANSGESSAKAGEGGGHA